MNPVQPTALELLLVVALLLAERDALLITLGRTPPQEGRVEYSREQLEQGRQLGPASWIGESGQVVVRCDT